MSTPPLRPRCTHCGVPKGDPHTSDCPYDGVVGQASPRGPDPFISADPFWGTLGLGAENEGVSAPMSGWYPASAPKRRRRQRLGRWLYQHRNASWWPLVAVLALCGGTAIGILLAHTGGPDPTPPAKVYGDCHLEVYDTDKADSGTWSKVTTPGYDCPPMQVWPTVLVNR